MMNSPANMFGNRRKQGRSLHLVLLLPFLLLNTYPVKAQAPDTVAGIPVNYDEDKVGKYQLPDPLLLANGEKVDNADTWYEQRRPELLELFKEFQFGRAPEPPADLKYNVFDKGTVTHDGTAVRKQVTVYFSSEENEPSMELLIYLPAEATAPVPILFTPSFLANSTRVNDPGVKRGHIWNREQERVPAPEKSNFGELDVQQFISRGIGIATVYYGDIEPDFEGGYQHGVRGLYREQGQNQRRPDEWGAISAWAWGLSRAMDYFETDRDIDAARVALMGISRLGKTVLWAAARDQRFAAVIASCSGEGGAALSRRNYGETVAHLTAPSRYPYQFAPNYQVFAEHVNQLPVDGNLLLSLIAPRPLLLQTGNEDLWSDPRGEFLAAADAARVYRLLGEQGLGTDQWPSAGNPVFGTISYFMHEGGHGTLPTDWEIFLKFLEKHLVN
ncbi:alpha/beta hydrolase family protein [Halalkalibaculum sp. DA3122]